MLLNAGDGCPPTSADAATKNTLRGRLAARHRTGTPRTSAVSWRRGSGGRLTSDSAAATRSETELRRLHLDQLSQQLLPGYVVPAITFANHLGDLHRAFGPLNLYVFDGPVAGVCVMQPELNSQPSILPDLMKFHDFAPTRVPVPPPRRLRPGQPSGLLGVCHG